MDGYHLANSTLDRLGIHDRKGAIETFDGWGFVALLDRLRSESGHTVYAPSFDRTVDEGVAGEIAIDDSATVVVIEGNYLLSDVEPWGGIRDRLDAAWFCCDPGGRARASPDRSAHPPRPHRRRPQRHGRATSTGPTPCSSNARDERAELVISGVTASLVV